jgi:hypothetical protein
MNISSTDFYPWGELHNDYLYKIDDYQSISHYLYSSILPNKYQNSIKKININKLKNTVYTIYTNHLEELQLEAIQTAIDILLRDIKLYKLFDNTLGTFFSDNKTNNII